MCRNHSHITAALTGHLRVGPTDLLEVEVAQPLEVQLPFGEKLIKSSGTVLYVPASRMVPLPALTQATMVVSFTPLFFTTRKGTIITREMASRLANAGEPGLTGWTGMDTSRLDPWVENE